MIDTSPGSLDGPPVSDSKTSPIGIVLGAILIGTPIVFILVGMAWAIAWMIVNFPTHG